MCERLECVRKWVCEREGMRGCVWVSCMCVRERVCVCGCVWGGGCECVCVSEEKGEWAYITIKVDKLSTAPFKGMPRQIINVHQ